MNRIHTLATVVPLIACFGLAVGCASLGRKMLYFPTHHPADGRLAPWRGNGNIIGCSRDVRSPGNVWLVLCGNAGQASDRTYALPSFSPRDSVFILDHPGYGDRDGRPSEASLNRAARDAYLYLRARHHGVPVCVVGESIGSGPACTLAKLNPPPDKLVLIVPFDALASVARDHFPAWLVGLVLRDNWNNIESLSGCGCPVEIFGAKGDAIIPIRHAKALAAAVPASRFVIIPGGHNDWSDAGKVRIRNP